MAFFSDLQAALDALRGLIGDDVDAIDVPAAVARLADDGVVEVIAQATVLVRGAESVRIAASGAAASRSTRDAGHSGLAQTRGHRSAVSLIQDLTGTSRADATKQVRLGEALTEAATFTADTGSGDAGTAGTVESPAPMRPWHARLGDALLTGTLTSAQHDAIYRGLGEPPTAAGCACDPDVHCACRCDNEAIDAGCACRTAANLTARDAWHTAATQLIDEARVRTVEELASAARTIRDLLDPAGATRRFEQRFDARAFRTWTDRDGTRRGTFTFDDEGGAWIDTIITTALRLRRGGPRFVDPAEKARADQLVTDPRSNDQLTYDLIMDVLRAGALADTDTVFGTRQAGIRIITTVTAHHDAAAGRPAVALLEDTNTTLPGWLLAQHTCTTGTIPISLDQNTNPLDLGRETRLYTPTQRIALAIRDGGCPIPGCDRPASYCEAHHIDQWARDHGHTDIDRGILLCHFHHMNLHHHHWRITREGKEDFILHIPDQPPLTLTTRLTHRYAIGNLQPPPRRFHPAA